MRTRRKLFIDLTGIAIWSTTSPGVIGAGISLSGMTTTSTVNAPVLSSYRVSGVTQERRGCQDETNDVGA